MDRLKALTIPPVGKNELLVVKPEVWDKLVKHIEEQRVSINELKKEVSSLKEMYRVQDERIVTLAEALGGVYEDEE